MEENSIVCIYFSLGITMCCKQCDRLIPTSIYDMILYFVNCPKCKTQWKCSGGQHYKFIKYWHKTNEQFKYNKKLDKIKKNFAKKNGIYIEIDMRTYNTVEKSLDYILNNIKEQENEKLLCLI